MRISRIAKTPEGSHASQRLPSQYTESPDGYTKRVTAFVYAQSAKINSGMPPWFSHKYLESESKTTIR
jgi:hypothetical protein